MNLEGADAFFRRAVDLDRPADRLARTMKVFRYYDLADREAWFRMLAYKHASDGEQAEAMIEEAREQEEKFSYAGEGMVAVLSSDRRFAAADVFEIYKFKNRLEWSDFGMV